MEYILSIYIVYTLGGYLWVYISINWYLWVYMVICATYYVGIYGYIQTHKRTK